MKVDNLVFVTEGKLEQVVGIACVINCLSKHPIFKDLKKIWIIVPQEHIQMVQTFYKRLFNNLNFNFINGEVRNDDKYYIQVSLRNVFTQVMNDETILCIDYDHLVVNPKITFNLLNNGITVSSEFSDQFEVSSDLQSHDNYLPTKHFNASLIYGTSVKLRLIGETWAEAYEELRQVVPQRNRVELAFTLAAERKQIAIAPCNPKIQSNFACRTLDCFLFHYGGDSELSQQMKNKLLELSNKYVQSNINVNYLTKIHEELVDLLKR